MSILQSLKAVAVQRPTHLPAIVLRRHKLIERIHQQVLAAEARQQGKQAMLPVIRRIKDKATGEVSELRSERPIREQFWLNEAGQVFFELRYGVRPLEFAKGKTTIEIGQWNSLIPTLQKLKQATEQGEFDEQLGAISGRLQAQLDAKKAKGK